MFEIPAIDSTILFKTTAIPPKPKALVSVLQFLKDLSDPEKISDDWLLTIVKSDPQLKKVIINAVNTADHYSRGHVTDVKQALAILGVQKTLKFITRLSLEDIGLDKSKSASEIWNHCFRSAFLLSRLSYDLSAVVPVDAYLFGLLHDCGSLLMHLWFEEKYEKTLLIASKPGYSLLHVENDRHNVNHALAGAELARLWGFNDTVCEAIRYHHSIGELSASTSRLSNESKKLIALGNLVEYATGKFGGVDSPIMKNEARFFIEKSLEFLNISKIDLEKALHKQKISIKDTNQYASIKDSKVANINTSYLDFYDSLTGLPNQLILKDRVQQAILFAKRSNKPLAILYLQLMNFSSLSELYDQKTADYALVSLSHKMEYTLRKTDSLIRLEEDQFIILLNDLDDIEKVNIPLQKLLDLFATPIVIEKKSIIFNVSIGVCFFGASLQSGADDVDQLIDQAHQAMELAQQQDRTNFVIYEHRTGAVENPLVDSSIPQDSYSAEKVSSVADGLKQGQFILYFQPKVNMLTGELIGAEALIRWQHPTKGILSPNIFLPQLKNHPASIEMGDWVIDRTLSQIQHWQSIGLDIPISINLSMWHLKQENFIAKLEQIMAGYPDVKRGQLEFEVVEDNALINHQQLNEKIRACKTMGIEFILDDFGVGATSFTSLSSLTVKSITLDRGFVAGMEVHLEMLAVIQSIITLATLLERNVVAKGIETLTQRDELLKMGCIYGQGYAIAKPMLAEELIHWKLDKSWKVNSLH